MLPQAGNLDLGFANSGFFISDNEDLDYGQCVYVLPDDKILMAGGNDYFSALKLLPNGAYDTSFGTDGKLLIPLDGFDGNVSDIAVQPDGKIILAGHTYILGGNYYSTIVRLNPNGTMDTTFNGTGKLTFDFNQDRNQLYAVALQQDGKIVVAGSAGNSSSSDFVVARINTDGTLDSTFDNDGKKEISILGIDYGKDLKIQPDGKILICGYSYPGPHCDFAVVRLNTDGTFDNTFSGDGIATTKVASSYGNDTVQNMALQDDGKILVLADSYVGLRQIIGVIRLTSAGELDPTFSGDGKFSGSMNNTTDYPRALAIQSDGKILIANSFYVPDVNRHLGLMRLTSAGELDTTFSGDGKTDFEVPLNNGCSVYDMKLQSTGQILVAGTAINDFMLARIFSGNELATPQWENKSANFYPNPAMDEINFPKAITEVKIFSLDGKLVAEQKNTFGQMDISNLQEGMYLIRTKTSDAKISQQKLVVKR